MKEKVKAFLAGEFEQALRGISRLREIGETPAADSVLALFEEVAQSKIDPVTDLLRSDFFFERLTERVTTALPDFEVSGVFPDIFKGDLFLLAGELAFLDYFKRMSLYAGDVVLHRVAFEISSAFADSWAARLSDCELAVFVEGDTIAHLKQRKDALEAEVAKEPLHFIELEPVALSEVKQFLLLQPLPSEGRIGFIVLVWLHIAKARARIAKYYKRHDLMLRLYEQGGGTYSSLLEIIRLGAGGITKEEFLALGDRYLRGESVAVDCLASALNATSRDMQDAGPYAAIFKVAERVFIETP